MYIHPFVAGIMFTILAEIVFTIALVVLLNKNNKNDKEKENESTDNTN